MKCKYLITLIYIITIIIITTNSSADMLVTNSGQELKGSVLDIDNNKVTFSFDNKEKVFNKDEILTITFTEYGRLNDTTSLTKLNDDVLTSALGNRVIKENYPNAGYVTLYNEKRFTYTKDKKFVAFYRSIIQVLQERGKNAGVITLPYKENIQTAEVIHGRTINDDTVYDYDRSSMRESSMFFRYPDYDQMKLIKFPLSNIVVGSVLDYEYSVTQTTIDTFEPVYKEVYFYSGEPALKKRLVIRFPKGNEVFDISERFMGKEGSDYTFVREDDDEYTTYIYEKNNIKAIEEESYMPSDDMIMPKVTVSLSPGFDEITKKYSYRLKKALVISGDIYDKVRELVRNAATKEEKIFNIYNYIIKEINLIPISPAHYSYLPNKSDDTYKKKSGSYIDKTFLLYAFLKAADINCDFALARGRESGEILDKNPSIKQFNYPVIIIPLDLSNLYLTAIDNDLMITDIYAPIQGGLYLTVSKVGGEISKIPQKAPEKENVSSRYVIDLFKDGSIKVKETKKVSGNNQGSLRMFQYLPEKNLEQYMVKRVHGIHPNASLVDYKFEKLDDLMNNPKMEISYIIKDYMISAGGRLFAFQLPSLSYHAYGVGKKERNYPLSFGRLVSSNKEYILQIPDSYKVYYLPKKYIYKSDYFTYEATYKADGNKIIFKDSYERLSSFMPKEAYFELKKCLETKAKLAKEWIVIEEG